MLPQLEALQALLDSVPTRMFSVDRDYLYTAFNRSYAQSIWNVYGTQVEIGRSLLESVTAAGDRQRAAQNLERALNGEQFVDLVFRDDETLASPGIEVRYIPQKDPAGAVVGVCVITQEISEALYRSIFEDISAIILFFDPQGGAILDANPAACAFYGRSRPELKRLNISDLSVLPVEKTRQRTLEIAAGEITRMRDCHRLANGEVREVDISLGRQLLGGRAVMTAVVNDITTQVRAEQELSESEERLRGTLESMQEGVMLIGYDWRYLYINKAAEIQGRQPKEELLGRTVMECWPGIAENDFFKLERKVMEARIPAQIEGPFTFPDGELHWFEWHIQPAQEGLLILTVDNTARKQEEQNLRESEERFNRAFRASPLGFNIFRLEDGRYIDANPAYLEMIGYSREEVIGHTAAERNLLVKPEEHLAWIQALRQEGIVRNVEVAIRTKSGDVRNCLASFLAFEMGGESLALVLYIDITARKQAEALLLIANTTLEQRVVERSAELQATNTALEKALRARDQFMAAMSHELRTPLTSIISISDVLLQNVYGELNEKQLQAVQNIYLSGERLLEVINDVLVFTQIQSGGLGLHMGRCLLAEVCQSSLETVRGKADARDQQLAFSISPETILLEADRVCLKQVLVNLLSNAVKFTPKGGRIELAAAGLPEAGEVRICVSDTGIGIKQEDFPRLFQPFVQLDARLGREYEGTGLGLALVKGLVELHGGRVEVESVFGQGSTFIVILPWPG